MMINVIKKLWTELNKIRCLEISYTTPFEDDKPIIEDVGEDTDVENVRLMVDYHSQILRLQANEQRSKEKLAKWLLNKYQKQGLLPTKKQLVYDVESSWNTLKNSNLVDGFNNFKSGVDEVLNKV